MIKTVYVNGVGEVTIARRRGTRHLRISLPSGGGVRLSIPYGVTESKGLSYLQSKVEWVAKHKRDSTPLKNGMRIGKAHQLLFLNATSQRVSSSIKENEVRVFVPDGIDNQSLKVQTTAKRAAAKALKLEAENLLKQRLNQIAAKDNFKYSSLRCAALKSRWGSCSSQNDIVLNIYLMQLKWELIDYVIIHELAHTVHHNHSHKFWELVESIKPDYRSLRKELKTLHPGAQ